MIEKAKKRKRKNYLLLFYVKNDLHIKLIHNIPQNFYKNFLLYSIIFADMQYIATKIKYS